MKKALAGKANLSIIRSQTGDFTRSKGKEVMEGFLKAEDGGKDICAVYAHNDDMAVGAIQAIKDAGLKPGTDILVVSIDAVPDIFAAMVAGEANATVELTPNMAGPAFAALDAYPERRAPCPKSSSSPKSKLYTPADDPQGEYDRRKGLGLLSFLPEATAGRGIALARRNCFVRGISGTVTQRTGGGHAMTDSGRAGA